MKEDLVDTDSKCILLKSQESQEFQKNFIAQLLNDNNELSEEFSDDEERLEQNADSYYEEVVKDDDYYGDMSELDTSQFDNF